MKAMILAAGKGTRLTPFTNASPKPMLKVLGEPIVDHILGFLKRSCIDDVVINTSYMGDKIQAYLGDGSRYRMNFTYSFEGIKSHKQLVSAPLGSAGGLRKIQADYKCFDETFVVICGDALVDFDLDYALAFHKSNKSIATVMIKEINDSRLSQYGVVDMNNEGQINQFQEKPNVSEAISNKVSTGVYIFEPEIFDFIPTSGTFDIGGDLLPLLASQGERIFGCETEMQWLDIGNLYDYWQAQLAALYHEIRYFPVKGEEVKPGVFVAKNVNVDWSNVSIKGPVYIGSGATIGNNVSITGPAIISENCNIGDGSILSNVVVDPYVSLNQGTSLEWKWANSDFTIILNRSNSSISVESTAHGVSDSRCYEGVDNISIISEHQSHAVQSN